jgi:hypothetical protein
VLEKHEDFSRHFRGDTVHPSTRDVLDELNLLDDFLRLPHQEQCFRISAAIQIGIPSSSMLLPTFSKPATPFCALLWFYAVR